MLSCRSASAVGGQGLSELTERVRWYFLKPALHLTLDIDCDAGKLLAFLKKHTEIHQTDYFDNQARIELTLSANWLGAMRKYAGQYTLVSASDSEVHAILDGDRIGTAG